jgi:hypothetical protein
VPSANSSMYTLCTIIVGALFIGFFVKNDPQALNLKLWVRQTNYHESIGSTTESKHVYLDVEPVRPFAATPPMKRPSTNHSFRYPDNNFRFRSAGLNGAISLLLKLFMRR